MPRGRNTVMKRNCTANTGHIVSLGAYRVQREFWAYLKRGKSLNSLSLVPSGITLGCIGEFNPLCKIGNKEKEMVKVYYNPCGPCLHLPLYSIVGVLGISSALQN